MSNSKITRAKLEIEYPFRSSIGILFQYISNPSGLQSWFADAVSVSNGIGYKFKWNDGTESDATLTKCVTNKYVRFRMADAFDADEYMEFRIQQDSITGDIDLVITEFVNAGEGEMAASIWDTAVDNLKYIIGG
ncbi:MAG: START-like domain-containing protein [Bacteroidetes bacterium]|nr:START-like domain-containing protein [Bacteroidota bacterium]